MKSYLMTVQQLIDNLKKIEDKRLVVIYPDYECINGFDFVGEVIECEEKGIKYIKIGAL